MSIVFKEIFKENVNITPHTAHKNWNVTDETTGSYGIKKYTAISSSYSLTQTWPVVTPTPQSLPPTITPQLEIFDAPISTGSQASINMSINTGIPWGYEYDGISHGIHNAMTWQSLDVLYYRPNRYNFTNMGQPFGTYVSHSVTKLDTVASVLSIPQQICGDGINPKSISLTSTGIAGTIKDDGTGYLVSASKNVGDVFYSDGMIVVTNTSSAFQTVFQDFQLSFQGTHDIVEHEYSCIISEKDFLVTQNPTAMVASSTNYPTGSGILAGFASSSDFSPYITTVGLYSETGDLLVVGKPSQPIQKSQYHDLEFVLRFDT